MAWFQQLSWCDDLLKRVLGRFTWKTIRNGRSSSRLTLRTASGAQEPGIHFRAIITLALGIGATTAIFSVVHTVLLHSAPYARSAELVAITEKGPTTEPDETSEVSTGDFTERQAEAPVLAGMAAYQSWEFHALSGSGSDPDEVWASPVTPNLFQVLGVNAFLGRTFAPDETQAMILSHQYWRSHFASDPRILGKALALDGKLYRVIGIAPPDFEFPAANAQMWTPLTFSPADRANYEDHRLSVVARLNPGVTLRQAQAFIDTIATRLAAQYPKSLTPAKTDVEYFKPYKDEESRLRARS